MPKNPFPSKKVSWWWWWWGGVGAKMILMSAPFPFLTLLTKRMTELVWTESGMVLEWVWSSKIHLIHLSFTITS